jgi:nucleoside-diphosphate-sugar epimerase
MKATLRVRVLLETGMRIVADIIMVIAALAIAMIARYIVELSAEGSGPPREVFLEYAKEYMGSFPVLTIISLIVFYASGFYTHGRFYQGRYKALVVGQAVTLSYLLFAFVVLLSQGAISLPRSALVVGWSCTVAFLIASRLWSMLWRNMGEDVTGSSTGRASQWEKRVLVIGGAGYIGSALLPKLLERGYRVRLLDLFLFGKEPIAAIAGHPNLEVIHADFRHVDKIVHAVRGMDEVIHLGAIVGDPACSLDEELTVEVNLMATRMIAEVAKGSGIRRFCFASTCSVYGANDHVLDERSELNPISLYAKSKSASEKVLLQLGSDGFSPVILRFGTVYGFSGRTRFDLIVNLLTAKAIVERKMTVFGGGQWRPFLHVDDAALALLKAVEAPVEAINGQVFNAGSNEQNYRLEDVAHIIQAFVPQAEILDMGADTDFRNYRVDFTRIRNLLNFAPQWQLGEGVKQVCAAFEHGKVTDYRNPMYSNVKFLSEEHNSRLIRREKGWAYDLINQDVKSITPSVAGSLLITSSHR